MLPDKKNHSEEKSELHPRNKHRQRYNFDLLIRHCADLAPYVQPNAYGDVSIDFFNPKAVLLLNTALLKTYYNMEYWEVPNGYLCPPVPGRADYIHYIADLLAGDTTADTLPELYKKINCLDIGTGANCIYPIIGINEYGWTFVASETDNTALEAAKGIVKRNAVLKGRVELRLQSNKEHIFTGIIKPDEKFDLVICDPPFHASAEEAEAATMRKIKNLKSKRENNPVRNFGGKNNELWYKGGEEQFIKYMVRQSKDYGKQCLWFSTLLSKSSSVEPVMHELFKAKAIETKTIPLSQGNKVSRIVAWSFHDSFERQQWILKRLNG